MAERKGITSVRFWEACYMDEKEKNIDLETKIAILEGDVRAIKFKKDELIKTNNELRSKVEELRAERDTLMQSLGALNDAYKEKDKALAKAGRTIERAQKWVSAQKRMCER